MHESTPRQSGNLDELRAMLRTRRDALRQIHTAELAAVHPTDEATGQSETRAVADIGHETYGAQGETQVIPEEPELKDKLQLLHEKEEKLRAEKQRVLDEAAEEEEQLRAKADKLERQRQAEIAAAEEERKRNFEAELARRRELEAQEAKERQRREEVRLAAEAEIAKQRAEAEAERQQVLEAQRLETERNAADKPAKPVPDTLEHPHVKKVASDDATSQADVIEFPTKKKRRAWPMVAAVASCVAIGAGGAVATGYDGGAIKRAQGLIDTIYPSQVNTPKVRGATVKLPKDIFKQVETSKKKAGGKEKADQPKPEPKPSDASAPAKAATSNSYVADVPVEKPAPAAESTHTSKRKPQSTSETQETGGAAAKAPEGLTAQQANPANYASNKPTGAAPYGNTPTEQGGAKPYVPKTP